MANILKNNAVECFYLKILPTLIFHILDGSVFKTYFGIESVILKWYLLFIFISILLFKGLSSRRLLSFRYIKSAHCSLIGFQLKDKFVKIKSHNLKPLTKPKFSSIYNIFISYPVWNLNISHQFTISSSLVLFEI